jgi:HEAT repeat protein
MSKKPEISEGGLRKFLMPGCLSAVILLPLGYWLFSSSTEDLLKADPPTDSQIRKIASTLLVDSDFRVCQQAADKLVKLGEKAVPILKDISLKHDDPKVRSAVVQILASINDNAASEAVSQMITHKDERMRQAALQAAARLNTPSRTEVIQKGLTDAQVGVRLSAIDAASRRRDQGSVPALEQALRDESITVRRHAAKTLGALTGRDYSNRVRSSGNH